MLEDTSIEIGTTARGKDLGYKSDGENLYVWLACPECGKPRWIVMTRAKSEQLPKCKICTARHNIKPQIKYDWSDLQTLYLDKKLSQTEIAKIKGCRPTMVSYQMRQKGIQARDKSTAQRLVINTGKKTIYRGKDCWNWNEGKTHHGDYVMVYAPEHPWQTTKTGWIRRCRLIWEQVHNKELPKGWVVHHLNGIKDDDRPENLLGLPCREHRLVLAETGKKIRELEAKVKLLERALEDNQLIFQVGGN